LYLKKGGVIKPSVIHLLDILSS